MPPKLLLEASLGGIFYFFASILTRVFDFYRL